MISVDPGAGQTGLAGGGPRRANGTGGAVDGAPAQAVTRPGPAGDEAAGPIQYAAVTGFVYAPAGDPSSAAPQGHPPHRGDTLACDGVSLAAIAAAVGTPCYVYSSGTLDQRVRSLQAALGTTPAAIHYALKANSTLAVIRHLRALGVRGDANSIGEIEVALRAGFIPDELVFTGVGKSRDELDRAIGLGVGVINAESPGELARIDAIAQAQGTRARVALRVNPDIDAGTHPNISTGREHNKFGMPIGGAIDILREAAARPGLHIAGIHVHIGSQIRTIEPLARAARVMVDLAAGLRDAGITLDHVDLGGGLGIAYDEGPVVDVADYATVVADTHAATGLPIVLEPGRWIVGAAGVLVARVIDVKQHPSGRRFVVLDAGMTELIRPALYNAFHRIVPVESDERRPVVGADIVGPVCESSDKFGVDRQLPELRVDDLVAVLDAGAYGAAMASNYNRRALPAEVFVEGGAWRIVKRRQSVDDMLALES